MALRLVGFTLLFGCTAAPEQPCMDGYSRGADGRCISEPDDVASETPSDPASSDTGEPISLVRGECAPDSPTNEPSIELIGQYDTDDNTEPPGLLIEALDGVVDQERFWVVGQGGLLSFDISGDVPELGDVFGGMSGRFYRLMLVDHDPPLVYATHRDSGLQIVDRSDPSDLRLVKTVTKDGLGGMVQVGDRVYATQHDGTLVVFDATDPTAPEERASIEAPGHPWNVVETNGWLYTADNTRGVGAFSLSDPDEPEFVGHTDLGNGVLDLATDGTRLFAAAGSAGLIVLDLSDPSSPQESARLWTGSPVVDVSVSDAMVWLVDHEAVWAVDVRQPDQPTVIGRMETPRFAMSVWAEGNEAWVGDWTAVEGYRAHPERAASTIVAHPDTLRLASDRHDATVRLVNLGPHDGALLRWDANETDATIGVSSTTVGAQDGVTIAVDWPESTGNGQVCLLTSDPSNPTVSINVQRSDQRLSVPVGTAAPDFELPTLDGERLRLSEQLGHPVLLVYFATW